MRLRLLAVTAVLVLPTLGSRSAQGQERWVEDEAVLARGSVRLTAGGGLLLMTYPGTEKDRITIYGGGCRCRP